MGLSQHSTSEPSQNQELETLRRENARLKAALHEAHRLQQEHDLRERFVTTLSHDLRTPLTAAKVCAQLLSWKPDDRATVQKLAGRIEDNINRVDQMIRDFLDANRIKAGEPLYVEIDACSLNQIASDTLEDLSTVHGDRFRLLTSGEEVNGHWSSEGIRRILENLCSNAVKYGATHELVTVKLGRLGSDALLEVHNHGSVIAPEERAALFEPFRRAASAVGSGQKGWGLGLTLVKGLAEAHGGYVTVESAEETGTTFRVVLPLDARIILV